MTSKRAWIVTVQVLITAAFLCLAIFIAKPDELLGKLAGADKLLVASSFLFIPVLVLLRSVRWRTIARTRKPGISLKECFHSYMAGLTLAVVTPWAAGELARGALAAPDDKAGFVGLTFLDKLMDLTMLFVFACAGLAVVAPGMYKLAALAAIAAAFAGWSMAGPVLLVLERLLPRSRLTGALGRALQASGGVPVKVLAVCFVLAALDKAVYYCQLYVIMLAFSPGIRPEAAGLFPLITLSRVVPSIAGLGVREFVAAAIFSRVQYEVTSAAAVAASLAQYVIANVVPATLWLVSGGGFGRFLAARREETGDGGG